jgi:peptide/nickel transport system substrate-binding protein
MTGRRLMLATAALALAALGAPATATLAASGSPSPANAQQSTFTVGFTQDLDSLNPFVGILASSYETYQLAYDTLTLYSPDDFSAQPGLASSWKTSSDGRTWTYTIRSGVKWSDGVPLTAHDVAYTFNRIMHGSFEKTNYGNYVANIESVTAPNDTTVVMKTKKPSPTMLHLYVYILPEHIWKNVSEQDVATFKNTDMVGSGPFIMEERKVGQFVRMRANPDYWGGAPHIKELVFRIFNNDDAMVQALRKGEIDFVDELESTVYRAVQNQPDIKLWPAVYSGFDEIGINTGAATTDGKPIGDGNPALKDKRLRQAINWAIDRDTLVKRVLNGYGTPGSSIIPPLYNSLHYEPPSGEAYTYDPAKANQILDDAGYKKDSSGVRVDPKTHKEVTLRLYGRSDSATSKHSVPFVQGWLNDIGLKVSTKIVSEDSLTEIIGNGEYDLFEWGWVVEPDPDYQLSTMTCGQRSTGGKNGNYTAGLSDSFYCNPQYDALYNQQKTEVDPAQRAETVKAAQKLVYDDAAYAVTFYYDDVQAYRTDRFTDFVPQPKPNGSLIFQYGVWSYRNIRPVAASSTASSSDDSSNTGVWIGVIVAAVVVAGGVGYAVMRRRSADERE